MTATKTQVGAPVGRLKMLFGIGIGNALEWYDWGIYTVFSVYFAPQFFHGKSTVQDVLNALAIYAVGFVARPFGGAIFGWIADRIGRQFSMMLTVGLAAFGSLVIGLTPTYTTIGSWAALVLVVCRLLQGLAHGGELPSAQTYISEVAPKERRGLWSSLIYFSGTIGTVLGTLLGAILGSTLSADHMNTIGWRVPFILGGVLGLYGLYMRAKMPETETFTEEAAKQANQGGPKESVWRNVLKRPGLLFRVIGMTMGTTVIYYVWGVNAPTYASTAHGVPKSQALWAGVFANLVLLALMPFCGMLSDRIGRKPMLLFGIGGLGLLLFPLNKMLTDSPVRLFFLMSIAMVFLACITSIGPAVYAEMFPTGTRAAGMAVPYAIAVAAFGGTAPYLQLFFKTHGGSNLFIVYSMCLAGGAVLVVSMMPETKGRDLTIDEPARESVSVS